MTTAIDLLNATAEDGRYHRQELISWWDQTRLQAGRVLVVGAGALGNEIVKGLTLLGVGHVEVVDMDAVEHSNLARCVLFRDGDEGRYKAVVVAERASEMNPNVSIRAHVCPVQRLGVGFLQRFDLVVAGLDSREARLWVGQSCRKLGLPWVDGAIEGLRGLARVFLSEGACYECTLGETDRKILANRRACALLSPEEMSGGKVPTNATTASIIAGVEVQEAVKILVGRDDLLALRGSAFMYTGEVLDAYHARYDEDEFCLSHDRYERIVEQEFTRTTRLCDLVLSGREWLDGVDAIELEDDLIQSSTCPECDTVSEINRIRSALKAGDGLCACGAQLTLVATRSIAPDEPAAQLHLWQLGLPLIDLITLRKGTERVHLAVSAAGNVKAEG